jgi:acyl carrier protein
MITEATLIEFLGEDLGVDTSDLAPNSLLFSTGVIDSFALVSLMTYLETEGRFRLSPTEVNLDNLDSIERIIAFCERKATAC